MYKVNLAMFMTPPTLRCWHSAPSVYSIAHRTIVGAIYFYFRRQYSQVSCKPKALPEAEVALRIIKRNCVAWT